MQNGLSRIRPYASDILLIAVTIPWIILLTLERVFGIVAVYEPNHLILYGEIAALSGIILWAALSIRRRLRHGSTSTRGQI